MGFLRDISRFVSKNPRPAISGIVAMLMMGALLLPASSASAEVTISVAPSFLEFAADPGTSFTEVITVGNEGDETTGIGVSVDDTTGSRAEISAVDWITAEPELFELPPGESQEVTLQRQRAGNRFRRGPFRYDILQDDSAVCGAIRKIQRF